MEYIAALLGNEGPGSLLEHLKKKNFATGLSAGSDLSTSGFELFQLSIDLTVEGAHAAAVVAAAPRFGRRGMA